MTVALSDDVEVRFDEIDKRLEAAASVLSRGLTGDEELYDVDLVLTSALRLVLVAQQQLATLRGEQLLEGPR
jgi:hypothetical protein